MSLALKSVIYKLNLHGWGENESHECCLRVCQSHLPTPMLNNSAAYGIKLQNPWVGTFFLLGHSSPHSCA